MRELFLDEGLEDRVLDDLRHLWESKMMQSKAMEDFRKNNINSSNFVLQLPANYSRTDQELTASVVIPASQNIHSFPMKNNSEMLPTFSLPAGLSYPVQIPAGVTLQTASGQLYKVNVPVVVTQAPVGQPSASLLTQKVSERREAPAPQSAAAPPNTCRPLQEAEPPSVPATSDKQQPHPKTDFPPGQENSLPQQPLVPPAETSQPRTHTPEVTLEENELSPQPEPLNLSMSASPCSQLLDFQISTEEALTQTGQLKTRDIDDILKEVIEEEREKAEMARNLAPAKTDNQSEAVLGLDLDYNYSELSDIVQLDGPAGNSDMEEEEAVSLEDNDFLGIINAEAIKALQEGDGSSDGISCSSGSDGADELANVEEEIHRSKNRWKFHLKDGVMCYGGRDYVFSKAVGEAEW
ncbi:TFIIA-alpha and beta-like factor isoform X2 [Cebidichthys violaceus]|uniref:TFIIA-alpha and beta-like factor isoform X2 n=1 Tax=Cebidichthys violaceus TaxID=271503 RepID=UPI0035C980E8